MALEMLTLRRLTLFTCTLLSLTVSIRGLCQLPERMKKQVTGTTDQLWAVQPKNDFDWVMYLFSDTELINLDSNTKYTCQTAQTDPTTGLTKILYKRVDTGTTMCFYGQLASDDATNKVLLYKKSVESTTNPPASLAECEGQTGIDGAVYTIMVRAPFTAWSNQHQFSVIPDGSYHFSIKKGSTAPACENEASSTLNKANPIITVSSSCVTNSVDSYSNPFGQAVKITDSISATRLGLGTSETSGFLIYNTEKNNAGTNIPYRFYIAKYEIVDGAFRMFYESKVPDLLPKGYWSENLIPTDREPVAVTLRSTACFNTAYCSNGGTCVPGFTTATCVCTEAYEGDKCTKVINMCDPTPCKNGGACQQNQASYTCTCTTGYTGKNCELTDKCTPNQCQNSGTCYTYRDSNSVDQPYCKCTGIYTGDTCTEIDPCLNNPCKNGGSCLSASPATSSSDFKCRCASGYYGATCENTGSGPCVNQPCLNGGTCEAVDSSFVCRCTPSFTGNTCEVAVGCGSKPCKNGGTCSEVGDSFLCECTSFYSGTYCEEYEDWFIILLVLVILSAIIFVILIVVCSCYFCCGWQPGSNKTPYESYVDQQTAPASYGGDVAAYQPSYAPPAEPIPDTVQFNFVPLSQYQGIATTAR